MLLRLQYPFNIFHKTGSQYSLSKEAANWAVLSFWNKKRINFRDIFAYFYEKLSEILFLIFWKPMFF